ncbi:hypothetical protein [Conexibacter arvalis]|uniref:Rhodanese domain-containing protein n=1 Tax=Conexibacter arvalis TaxID=912552 RepID=A0A840IKE2_9ACTN|nr:hypothetical protein [Conexibacter arvalis]MBB4664795.1 hypothetical protein [Conexibacter arvalis]
MLDILDGDRRDERARRSRAVRAAEILADLGAPEAARLAGGLLAAVGGVLEVRADATSAELGFAGEIAVARRSAFSGERDFGAYEVKTLLARDENRALRLFGWRAERRTLGELRRHRSIGELGLPLVTVAGEGERAGLLRTPRMLFVSDERGGIVWRRAWAAFEEQVEQRVGAVVMLGTRTGAPRADRRRLEIVRATVMWQPEPQRLAELIDRGHAGLLVDDGLALAVRRSMLPSLYRCVVIVERRALTTRSVLTLRRPRRAAGPALDGYAQARNEQPRRWRRHIPMQCACCRGPLSWSAGCTVCRDGVAF